MAKSETADQLGQPDDLNITFYSVDGDPAFHLFVSYLQSFGVPWTIVCDGAAFRLDRRTKDILTQLRNAGIELELPDTIARQIAAPSDAAMTLDLFHSLVEEGGRYGVYTLAEGWVNDKATGQDNESFESFVLSQQALGTPWKQVCKEVDGKTRRGRLIAERTDCPPPVNDLFRTILERMWSQGMPKLAS